MRVNNVQLFATTHNLDSLKGLGQILDDAGYASFHNEISAFKLLKDKNSKVSALKYDYPSFSYSINQELEMRWDESL